MQKSTIPPSLLQSVLDSASNAATKGQAQYFTPVELAQTLASLLPKTRPVILDLTCGNGQLLAGAANSTTTHLLGCDIDPCWKRRPRHPLSSVASAKEDLSSIVPQPRDEGGSPSARV